MVREGGRPVSLWEECWLSGMLGPSPVASTPCYLLEALSGFT